LLEEVNSDMLGDEIISCFMISTFPGRASLARLRVIMTCCQVAVLCIM